MERVSQKLFKRAPDRARLQTRAVIRGKHDLGPGAAGPNLVGASNRRDTAFDTQTLVGHFECQKMRRLNRCDLFYQIPSTVKALNSRAQACLVSLGP